MCSERQNISLAVGTRIKNFRTERKMSQETLALAAEVNHTYLGQIERGEKCPTISTVYKICDKLKISLSQLLDFDMEIKPTNEEARYRIDKVLSDLPDDKTVELAEIVERIAEMQH
ncbi:MAG: helix-turn-helix transcriptional regulator [Ruminococcus sp.]|nr:helix-turn-helix transcriptional regulator [Ruminococcus sp.]